MHSSAPRVSAGPQTWRELLGEVIRNPSEEQRLTEALGVRPITLARWAAGKTDPRPHNLRQLLNALPEQRELLVKLIESEFTGLLQQQDDAPRDIPSYFYKQVMRSVVLTPAPVRFWSISNTILQQALEQLDPERLGMEISVLLCMPPRPDGKIRSLRGVVAIGSPPWRTDFAEKAMFYGAESLCGYAVSSAHRAVVQHAGEVGNILPFHLREHEQSLASFPLAQGGNIAGCLRVSSRIPHYFLPGRIELVEDYAGLLVLATLNREDFYDPKSIELRWMPPLDVQQPLLATFHQRAAELLREAAQREDLLNKAQAEQVARQEIEAKLLSTSAGANASPT